MDKCYPLALAWWSRLSSSPSRGSCGRQPTAAKATRTSVSARHTAARGSMSVARGCPPATSHNPAGRCLCVGLAQRQRTLVRQFADPLQTNTVHQWCGALQYVRPVLTRHQVGHSLPRLLGPWFKQAPAVPRSNAARCDSDSGAETGNVRHPSKVASAQTAPLSLASFSANCTEW